MCAIIICKCLPPSPLHADTLFPPSITLLTSRSFSYICVDLGCDANLSSEVHRHLTCHQLPQDKTPFNSKTNLVYPTRPHKLGAVSRDKYCIFIAHLFPPTILPLFAWTFHLGTNEGHGQSPNDGKGTLFLVCLNTLCVCQGKVELPQNKMDMYFMCSCCLLSDITLPPTHSF